MHEYHCINDLLDLSEEDPELWREIYGYMQVCLQEDDEADLSFRVCVLKKTCLRFKPWVPEES